MATDQQSRDPEEAREHKVGLDRDDEEHQFVDQSKIDFDPDEGLYSGTAVTGTSEIPGPHLDDATGELPNRDTESE
jgi:hypothetical protein